jgi:hypothetical protein
MADTVGIPEAAKREQFTVTGTVPGFQGPEFLMAADNGDELTAWITAHGIDTHFTKIGGRPAVKIRGRLAAQCRPGLRIRHTIEVYDRRDGRRVRGVSVEPL